jgi:hypothetical protein
MTFGLNTLFMKKEGIRFPTEHTFNGCSSRGSSFDASAEMMDQIEKKKSMKKISFVPSAETPVSFDMMPNTKVCKDANLLEQMTKKAAVFEGNRAPGIAFATPMPSHPIKFAKKSATKVSSSRTGMVAAACSQQQRGTGFSTFVAPPCRFA